MPGVAYQQNSGRLVCGVGYRGNGEYGRTTHASLYHIWYAMLRRCYSKKAQACVRGRSYVGCKVVKRWHNFQNFCQDIVKMPNWNTKGFSLDKDGRKVGNKTYGPAYCSFVPDHVNIVLSSFDSVGVVLHKGHYVARLSKWGKLVTIAQFKSYDDAIKAYSKAKIAYLKEVAAHYKAVLHKEVYKTLRTAKCPV